LLQHLGLPSGNPVFGLWIVRILEHLRHKFRVLLGDELSLYFFVLDDEVDQLGILAGTHDSSKVKVACLECGQRYLIKASLQIFKV